MALRKPATWRDAARALRPRVSSSSFDWRIRPHHQQHQKEHQAPDSGPEFTFAAVVLACRLGSWECQRRPTPGLGRGRVRLAGRRGDVAEEPDDEAGLTIGLGRLRLALPTTHDAPALADPPLPQHPDV